MMRAGIVATLLVLLPALGISVPAAAESVINQQVRIESPDGSVLAGTMTLPTGATFKVPGLLLIQGSGPTDRDGNQPPVLRTDLLRQIADGLAQQGIATLRYDKRGIHANAAGRPSDTAAFAAYFDWPRFVDDAGAALAFLRRHAVVDADKTGVFGHSEGGLVALELATSLTGTEAPRALILAATPGRRIDVVLKEQLQRQLAEQKASSQQRKAYVSENDRITRVIRETGQVPSDVPPGLQGLYPSYIGPFWQSLMQFDPAAAILRYGGPVLLLHGEADRQVSAERDALALDRALQQRPQDDHSLFVLPRTSHNLKALQGDSDPGFDGDLDPGLIRRLTEWLHARMAMDRP